MKHLSALDASFIHLETAEMPMHVGCLYLLDLPQAQEGEFVDAVRRQIAARMHLATVFGAKLAPMPLDIANPVWIEDDDLDLDYHIRSTSLPRPGTRTQLDACVARLHSTLLDRSRPLWECHLIEGLASGQLGLYTKIHHAALDGQGAVALAQVLLDVSATPREVDAPPREQRAGQPPLRSMLKAALGDTAAQYLKLARGLPAGVRAASALLAQSIERAGAARAAETETETETEGWLARLSMAPRTPLNVSIGKQRVFAALTLSLQEAQAVGAHFGATLNEVVLAIVSGALRRYLDLHDALPAQPLVAAVPVSLRAGGDTGAGNQVSMMLVKLASEIADPPARLAAIVAASRRMKQSAATIKTLMPTALPSLGLPWLMRGLTSLYGRAGLAEKLPPVANLVVSNLPGPNQPLYLAGARVAASYPLSIVTHGLALNVTLQSYNGALDIGITACRRAMPDLPTFAACMQGSHEELLAAAWAQAAPPPNANKARAEAAPRRRAAAKRVAVTVATPAPAAPRKRKARSAPIG